jgi:hypothetical protein
MASLSEVTLLYVCFPPRPFISLQDLSIFGFTLFAYLFISGILSDPALPPATHTHTHRHTHTQVPQAKQRCRSHHLYSPRMEPARRRQHVLTVNEERCLWGASCHLTASEFHILLLFLIYKHHISI